MPFSLIRIVRPISLPFSFTPGIPHFQKRDALIKRIRINNRVRVTAYQALLAIYLIYMRVCTDYVHAPIWLFQSFPKLILLNYFMVVILNRGTSEPLESIRRPAINSGGVRPVHLCKCFLYKQYPNLVTFISAKHGLSRYFIAWKVMIYLDVDRKPILPKYDGIRPIVLHLLKFKHLLDSIGILSYRWQHWQKIAVSETPLMNVVNRCPVFEDFVGRVKYL